MQGRANDSGERLPPPRKRLGQHFLSDPRILSRIADALELTGSETVVEIGPGRGALTDILVHRAGRVIAVEIDGALAERLSARYAHEPRVTVIEKDVLEVDLADAAAGPFVLAGNVPYYITTPIIFHALVPPLPIRAVYLVQREVADRAAAAPGSGTYGALSVNVQAVARVEILFRVAPGAFHPPPKVDSAVIRLTPRPDPLVTREESHQFRLLVQDAFGLRRKQMRRVLRTILAADAEAVDRVLDAAGVQPDARPETLSPADFARIMRVMGPVPPRAGRPEQVG